MSTHKDAVYRAAMTRFREWRANHSVTLGAALKYTKCDGRTANALIRTCARAERAQRKP